MRFFGSYASPMAGQSQGMSAAVDRAISTCFMPLTGVFSKIHARKMSVRISIILHILFT